MQFFFAATVLYVASTIPTNVDSCEVHPLLATEVQLFWLHISFASLVKRCNKFVPCDLSGTCVCDSVTPRCESEYLSRLTFGVQRFKAMDAIANPFPPASAPVENTD
jgi:hypothetical protein